MLQKLKQPFEYNKYTIREQVQIQKQRATNWSSTVRRIGTYMSDRLGQLILITATVILSSLLALLGPYLIGHVIDYYIVTKEGNQLGLLLTALVAIYAFHSLSLFLQNYWMIGLAQQTVYKMRTDLFRHLHRLPISFFDKRQHGELMSRVMNDMENVSSTLNSSFIQVVSSLLTLTGTIIVMLFLSPLLTLLTMLIIPVLIFGMRWITSRTRPLFKEQQRNLGEMNGFIEEILSGQRIVKAFSQEQQVITEFMEKNERLKQAGYWAQVFSGFIPKLMNVLNNLSFGIIVGIGGILAVKGIVSVGTIVIFAEYARQFTRPLNDLSNQINTVFSAIVGAERVFEIMDESPEEEEGPVHEEKEIQGNVTFSHVSFSYDKDGSTLKDITFEAAAGETVALVGPTGAGKTTIVNLLSRFYDANAGTIMIDGTNITEISREQLRKHMAFVLQDTFLFAGTIRENIRYGRLDATDEEVEHAAKLANAHSFIMKLPEQYDTVLKQDGSGISQGQKQLLAIARAMLANPSILILDEATSSIDTVTEVHIQAALQRLMKGRTSFVIAHRLNTIQHADRILVLQNGRLIENGSHEELLERKGLYSELHGNEMRRLWGE